MKQDRLIADLTRKVNWLESQVGLKSDRVRRAIAQDEERLSFGQLLLMDQLIIYTGTVRIAGVGKYVVAKTTLSLSGSVAYVYVYHALDHSATGVNFQATEPDSMDAVNYMFPLAKYEALDTGIYRLTQRYQFGGDIILAAPLG